MSKPVTNLMRIEYTTGAVSKSLCPMFAKVVSISGIREKISKVVHFDENPPTQELVFSSMGEGEVSVSLPKSSTLRIQNSCVLSHPDHSEFDDKLLNHAALKANLLGKETISAISRNKTTSEILRRNGFENPVNWQAQNGSASFFFKRVAKPYISGEEIAFLNN